MRNVTPLIFNLALLVQSLYFYGCLRPAAADDNILLTYEIDTVGFVEDGLKAHSKSDISDSTATGSIQTQEDKAPLQSWNQPYPASALVSFSKTLLGVPYQYGSTDPAVGFDCSGFITHVFQHFGLQVPRSSVEFTHKGVEVPVAQAQPGDLILFTGTDTLSTIVGHMGIVMDNSDSLRFIHSSSGKAHGVTITALNDYYIKRFVKIISLKNGL